MRYINLMFDVVYNKLVFEFAKLDANSVFHDIHSREYIDEPWEKCGLVKNFTESPTGKKKDLIFAVSIVKEKSNDSSLTKRNQLLKGYIDETDFIKQKKNDIRYN